MELIRPEKKYLQSYYEACTETWGHVHDSYILHNPDEYDDWKNHIFEDYKNLEKGVNLPQGFVPSITYWVVEGEEYIGTINIRPNLSERLKEYGGHAGFMVRQKYRKQGYGTKFGEIILNHLYQMGINDILMTCEETNIASKKILDKLNPVKTEKDTVLLNRKLTPIRRYYYVS